MSIAMVPERGPFSRFEGIDRWIACVAGQGMRVQVDGAWHSVPRHGDALAFAGEAECTGEPVGANVRDANLMVRRDTWRAHMSVRRGGEALPLSVEGQSGRVAIVHAFDASVSAALEGRTVALQAGETAVLTDVRTSGGTLALSGAATVVVIGVLRAVQASRDGFG